MKSSTGPKKKAARVAVTPRSIEYLQERGYLVANVEHWKEFPNPKLHPCAVCRKQPTIKITVDLWNFADLLAIKPDPVVSCIVLVQVTTRSHQADRVNKILSIPEAKFCLASGIRIEVHGWKKVGPRWEVAITEVKLAQFADTMPAVDPTGDLQRKRADRKQKERTRRIQKRDANTGGGEPTPDLFDGPAGEPRPSFGCDNTDELPDW